MDAFAVLLAAFILLGWVLLLFLLPSSLKIFSRSEAQVINQVSIFYYLIQLVTPFRDDCLPLGR